MSGFLSSIKKIPQAFNQQRPGTNTCLCRPGATTKSGMMRGSTLLLHPNMCEATHSFQLRSALHLLRIADLTPSNGSLLPLAGYSSSSSLEDI